MKKLNSPSSSNKTSTVLFLIVLFLFQTALAAAELASKHTRWPKQVSGYCIQDCQDQVFINTGTTLPDDQSEKTNEYKSHCEDCEHCFSCHLSFVAQKFVTLSSIGPRSLYTYEAGIKPLQPAQIDRPPIA